MVFLEKSDRNENDRVTYRLDPVREEPSVSGGSEQLNRLCDEYLVSLNYI